MTNTILAENFKKYRVAKNMTQEQAAEALHVNAQTISRWECGTTLPDALTLPAIAKLYCVTVDDFYKKQSIAYDNYAQRLSAVYEKTRDPEDFIRCRLEYCKLMKNGELSQADKWNYGTIHHFMLRYCKDVALEWYNKAIADGPENDPHIYRRSVSLRNDLMFELGMGDKVIRQQKQQCIDHPGDALNWVFLLEAYLFAKNYEEAAHIFQEATTRFPDNWILYLLGGEAYEGLENYDEAFRCWDTAGTLGTDFYDECYCKAICYVKMGEYQKAYNTYMDIANLLRQNGFDEEAEMAETEAKEILRKANP